MRHEAVDDYTRTLVEASAARLCREEDRTDEILEASLVLTSDLKLIARTARGQFVIDLCADQAMELSKRLHRAAQRGTKKFLSPLSVVPYEPRLDTTPYRVTLSTDAPVPRAALQPLSAHVSVTILEHSFDAIQLDGPELDLLWCHDPQRLIGRVRGLVLQPGRLIGTAFFFTTPFAQEIRARVDGGELSELSLTSRIEDWTELPDGAQRATRWRPIELSIEPPGGSGDSDCRITPLKDCYGN